MGLQTELYFMGFFNFPGWLCSRGCYILVLLKHGVIGFGLVLFFSPAKYHLYELPDFSSILIALFLTSAKERAIGSDG
jgi:hypothetical protein